jgi:hypothetical protein
MLGFVQRTPGNLYKTLIILKIMAARSFGNICANAVSAPYDLFTDGVPGKHVPAENDFPNLISQILRQVVNPKIFKICPANNNLWYVRVRSFQATDY